MELLTDGFRPSILRMPPPASGSEEKIKMTLTSLTLTIALAASVFADDPKPPTQIAWQPNLDAAVARAKAEGRPLLLAVNMDGESASERIVREQYRDPAFVGDANRCVPVIGSVFRHNPRDYDDRGRPILCPRLGNVTCGEHIALEPQIFERFMGGDRIAPRHVLIAADGTKRFDEFLLFDLSLLDKMLHDGIAGSLESTIPAVPIPTVVDTWRTIFLEKVAQESATRAAVLDQLTASAKKQKIAAEAAEIVRRHLMDSRTLPASIVSAPPDGELRMLAALDPENEATRFLLLAHRAMAHADSAKLLSAVHGLDAVDRVEKQVTALGPIDVQLALSFARAYRVDGKIEPKINPPRAPIEELEQTITDAAARLKQTPDDPVAILTLARASLDCARSKIEQQIEGAELHLADAEQFLKLALSKQPDDPQILLDLAKHSFVRGDYEKELAYALQARGKLPAIPEFRQANRQALDDAFRSHPLQQDALRWVGDAAARLISTRYGQDPGKQMEAMLLGGHALLLAATSPFADGVDWQSLVSFFSMLGLRQHALLLADEGVQRFPTSVELRNGTRDVMFQIGRPELGVEFAQREFNRHPVLGDNAWHLGYDIMVLAEWRRRMEAPDAAINEYQRAISAFARASELNPDYAGSCRHQRALCWQGIGFAHLLAQRQEEAADALVRAAAEDASIVGVRDGLDRETVDLIDQALEFRIGRPSPVDSRRLVLAIQAACPSNAFFPRSIADAMLREALRADGKNDSKEGDRCMLAAIDAAKQSLMLDAADEDSQLTLAQCCTVHAERVLPRDDTTTALEMLRISAPLMGEEPPAADATKDALTALAAKLRESLGEARPRFRPGR